MNKSTKKKSMENVKQIANIGALHWNTLEYIPRTLMPSSYIY